MTVTSWDDFPVHQTSEWIAHVATSDRNFYDRYYFNAFDHGGECHGHHRPGPVPEPRRRPTRSSPCASATSSTSCGRREPLADRADISVGPLRVEVLEPLKRLRFVVEPTEHSVALRPHVGGLRPGRPRAGAVHPQRGRVTFDTQRLAQMGSWSGTLSVGGQRARRSTRRPRLGLARPLVGRAAGRREGARGHPRGHQRQAGGMWSYFPMRFDDHCIFYICSERADGERSARAGRAGVARRPHRAARPHRARSTSSQPGHPPADQARRSSSPTPASRSRCTPLLPNFLAVGTGYGLEPDWRHGMYQGPDTVVQGKVYQVPEIRRPSAPTRVVDHAGRFELRRPRRLRPLRARLQRPHADGTGSPDGSRRRLSTPVGASLRSGGAGSGAGSRPRYAVSGELAALAKPR